MSDQDRRPDFTAPQQPEPWPQPGSWPTPGQQPPGWQQAGQAPYGAPQGAGWGPRPGGSIWLGILFGVLALVLSVVLWGVASSISQSALELMLWVLPIGLLGGGIALVANPRTIRVGAGYFIALGGSLVLLAGACVVLFAMVVSGG